MKFTNSLTANSLIRELSDMSIRQHINVLSNIYFLIFLDFFAVYSIKLTYVV